MVVICCCVLKICFFVVLLCEQIINYFCVVGEGSCYDFGNMIKILFVLFLFLLIGIVLVQVFQKVEGIVIDEIIKCLEEKVELYLQLIMGFVVYKIELDGDGYYIFINVILGSYKFVVFDKIYCGKFFLVDLCLEQVFYYIFDIFSVVCNVIWMFNWGKIYEIIDEKGD